MRKQRRKIRIWIRVSWFACFSLVFSDIRNHFRLPLIRRCGSSVEDKAPKGLGFQKALGPFPVKLRENLKRIRGFGSSVTRVMTAHVIGLALFPVLCRALGALGRRCL